MYKTGCSMNGGGSGTSLALQIASMAITIGIIPLIKYIFSREVKKLEEADTENRKLVLSETKRLEEADVEYGKKLTCIEGLVAQKFEKLKDDMNDLKNDLPFIYVTREDFIRSMDNIDRTMGTVGQKIDKLYDHITKKGE